MSVHHRLEAERKESVRGRRERHAEGVRHAGGASPAGNRQRRWSSRRRLLLHRHGDGQVERARAVSVLRPLPLGDATVATRHVFAHAARLVGLQHELQFVFLPLQALQLVLQFALFVFQAFRLLVTQNVPLEWL